MMGEIDPQGNLFGGDRLHLEHAGRGTFYAWLALEGPCVFPDGDFRDFYVLDNGRRSVPSSQMVWMVLLQWYDKTSEEESIERAKFDIRWKVALELEDHADRHAMRLGQPANAGMKSLPQKPAFLAGLPGERRRHPGRETFAAQYPARTLPCQRLRKVLTDRPP